MGDSKKAASNPSTLRQVIVIHRHGARFPNNKPGWKDPSWPQNDEFWKLYKGHLTPVGSRAMFDVGHDFRSHYVDGSTKLLSDVDAIDGHSVVCYATNMQRTIQSAWSLLLGFLGSSVPIFLAFKSDRSQLKIEKEKLGVPIFIQDATTNDSLFHEWRNRDDYKKWNKENKAESALFQKAAAMPEYKQLCDKLYEVCEIDGLQPENPMLDRIFALASVGTLVTIQKAHQCKVLANTQGISFTDQDMELIRQIRLEHEVCMFQHRASGEVSKSYGKRAARFLAHSIATHMRERAAGLSELQFVEYSCHDLNLAALSNVLGVELPEMRFSAYLVFELHEDDAFEGQKHQVKVLYNPDPVHGHRLADLKSHVLPLPELKVTQWEDLPVGSTPLVDLAKHCIIPEFDEVYEILANALSQSSENLCARVRKILDEAPPPEKLKESRHSRSGIFEIIDTDKNKHISENELYTFVVSWGPLGCKSTHVETLDMLWSLLGKESDWSHHDIEPADFDLLMYALSAIWREDGHAQG